MPENPNPFAAAARCGAQTRGGSPCRAPAVRGAARCRMHGGTGSGAPGGNQNALKDGFYKAGQMAGRRRMNAFIRTMTEQVEMFEAMMRPGGSLPPVRPPSPPGPGCGARSGR